MKRSNREAIFLTLLSTFYIVSCKPSSTEPEVNEAPVIHDVMLRYRHAHDDYWSNANLYSMYYVFVSDNFGDEDIVYLSIRDCSTCGENVLKDITSANTTDHISLYDSEGGYYLGDTYWYDSDGERRPATYYVYARDSKGQETIKTGRAIKPDLTEATYEDFAYTANYTGSDTAEGFEVLAMPTGSDALFGSGVFTITFNTNDINTKEVSAYFYDTNDNFIGLNSWAEGEFTPNIEQTLSDSDYFINSGYSETDVSYVHLFSKSGKVIGSKIDLEPFHSISAMISVTH